MMTTHDHSTLAVVPTPAVPRRGWRSRAVRLGRRTWRRLIWSARLVVSSLVLVGVLAALAAIPIVNLYVLGYLLEAEGRMGRGCRLREVLPWVRFAPRIAVIAFGTGLCLLPSVVLADFARDAILIDPTSRAAHVLWWTTVGMGCATAVYLFFVYARGGSLFAFLRPVKTMRLGWRRLRDGTLGDSIAQRLARGWRAVMVVPLLWLGLRGLLVAFVWLFVPCAMIAAPGPASGPRLLVALAGMAVLAVLFTVLMVLQAHMAARNQLWAGFSIRQGLRIWSAAPLAWLIAGFTTAVLALPLFLFKIVAPPRDAMWLLTPLFVAAMLPSRLGAGWAYRRAARHGQRRSIAVLLLALAASAAVGAVYAGGVFASQYINEHGRQAVFEQHAFSLPVPF